MKKKLANSSPIRLGAEPKNDIFWLFFIVLFVCSICFVWFFFFLQHVCPESVSLFCSFYLVRFLCETLRASLAFDIHLHLFAHIFFKVCSCSCITASGVLCAVCLVTTLSYFASLAFFFPAAKSSSSSTAFFFFSPFSYRIIYNKLIFFFFWEMGWYPRFLSQSANSTASSVQLCWDYVSQMWGFSCSACYSVCLRSTNKKYEEKQMWML